MQTALRYDRGIPETVMPPFEIRTHARYNPAAETSLNIVPGLVGTILTMTMLIFTALSVTREIERGTMESLLSMPITPVEIMLGKIVPYIMVGFIQAALILSIGILLFGVPLLGSLTLLALLSTLFITANLAIGYTFSTLAQNQLQAMQMSLMFFLPNILLSGLHVPVRRHAGVGAVDRRGAAADALSAHRALDHAEGRDVARPLLRHGGARRADAVRHGDRGHALPAHAGLICTCGRGSAARLSAVQAIETSPEVAPGAADKNRVETMADAVATTSDQTRRISIGFINFAHAIDHYVVLIFPTVVIGLEAIYGRSYAELIALGTASFVTFGVFSLPAGWLADRWSRRNMMAVFYFGCGVSLVAARRWRRTWFGSRSRWRRSACSRRSIIRSAPRC